VWQVVWCDLDWFVIQSTIWIALISSNTHIKKTSVEMQYLLWFGVLVTLLATGSLPFCPPLPPTTRP